MYFRPITFSQLLFSLKRKKITISNEESKLARVLSTFDLTALGIGSTLGVGVYVLAGEVSRNYAGPAVVFSFLIAAIASAFAGLCYAEFGARVPKAGSAYIYSYVSVGEFIAFIIGWNLILEYVIGSASVVKGLFVYIDRLADNVMSKWFEETMPIDVDNLATYPDFFSLAMILIFSVALAFGAKESSFINTICTSINLIIVLFVIISGIWKVNTDNWFLSKDEAIDQCKDNPNVGEGGFAPFGINGIIKGAAKCFYGFIGFDCIATAGEEAKTPQKSIPLAIVISLFIIFLSYFGISTVLTMMIPYCDQDESAPFPHVYEFVGWEWAKYVVSCGALAGLFASLLGAMFPLPRIIYAMSTDGLLFNFLGKVHPKYQTPFMGTLAAGVLTGVLACILDMHQLFGMMSIGTLFAYSMVAGCILILRFDIGPTDKKDDDFQVITFGSVVKQLYNRKLKYPTRLSSSIVTYEVAMYLAVCFLLAPLLSQCEDLLSEADPLVISGVVILAIIAIALVSSISCQPRSSAKLTFSVPLVPWLPAISMFINIYLMTTLAQNTWIQFAIWIAIGLAIYFLYGIWNSTETGKETQVHDKNDNIEATENGHK